MREERGSTPESAGGSTTVRTACTADGAAGEKGVRAGQNGRLSLPVGVLDRRQK